MESGRFKHPKRLSESSDSGHHELDPLGALFVNATIRWAKLITPGNTNIDPAPCDAVLFSADTVATVLPAEASPGETVDLPFAGKVWHSQACARVLAVTGGVTVTAGYLRRPPEAP